MATIFKRGGKGKRGARYYISYFDHNGRRQTRSARTTDKATAERIAAKLEADAALRRDGVVDPQLDGICEQSRRSVESHLKEGRQDLVSGRPLVYGQSITDSCLGWEDSVTLLESLAEQVRKRRS